MTLTEMETISDFYVIDLYDMIDSQNEGNLIMPENPIHGLRHDEVTLEDFEAIAQFGRIIKNYKKMKQLENC